MSTDDDIEDLKKLIADAQTEALAGSAVLDDSFNVFAGDADDDLDEKVAFFEPMAELLDKLESALANYSEFVDFEIDAEQAVIQVGRLAEDADIAEYDIGVSVESEESGEPYLVFEIFVGDELYDFKNAEQASRFLTQMVGGKLLEFQKGGKA